MSDIADTVTEALEKAHESRLHSTVAILVAVSATFMALGNVKDGNVVQAMSQDQARAVDAWGYYQAKGTKLNLAEATIDQLKLQRALATGPGAAEARALIDARLADYAKQVERYEREKVEIKATAEGYQKDFDRLNIRDDQLDICEALISTALALFGITALTRKRYLLWVAIVFDALGVMMGLAAFLGLNIHPDFLARLLG
jgi:hypothetical protein